MSVSEALLAITRSDRGLALECCNAAANANPEALLPVALSRHLRGLDSRGGGGGDVYEDPAALTRFIDGGSNQAMYDTLHAALFQKYADVGASSLLDLGCGEGRVALAAAGPTVTNVDLVEPSPELLGVALKSFVGSSKTVSGYRDTASSFLDRSDTADRWDVVQSTFALHTMERAERLQVLSDLAGRTDRLVIAEFDVPNFIDRSGDHARYVAERYEIGLREYLEDEGVIQSFLIPVMLAQFDPQALRHTFEQSAASWLSDLYDAGFSEIEVTPLFPYWWADAVLIEATCGHSVGDCEPDAEPDQEAPQHPLQPSTGNGC
jgi:SAM-dependent methyltransferase